MKIEIYQTFGKFSSVEYPLIRFWCSFKMNPERDWWEWIPIRDEFSFEVEVRLSSATSWNPTHWAEICFHSIHDISWRLQLFSDLKFFDSKSCIARVFKFNLDFLANHRAFESRTAFTARITAFTAMDTVGSCVVTGEKAAKNFKLTSDNFASVIHFRVIRKKKIILNKDSSFEFILLSDYCRYRAEILSTRTVPYILHL